jgi:hypothetical protein
MDVGEMPGPGMDHILPTRTPSWNRVRAGRVSPIGWLKQKQ